ncbi:MAG: baseplate J/gp47 family protein [bacterium]|nr:baseplate J/gp47 family protein [bacterium]
MAAIPDYLTEQTDEAILQRMLGTLPSDLDKAEGSFIFDALSPASIELSLAAVWAQEVLSRSFAATTFGDYLDLRCEEHGVSRRAAVKATGTVTFTGTAATVIPAGTYVATQADAVAGASSIEFVTTEEVTISGAGTGNVLVEAVDGGLIGNVAAGAISLMMAPVPGISAVTNAAALSGGLDEEDDASLLARYYLRVRYPSAGGNRADYVNWALEVPGVGGVSVVPVRDGAGTVSVAIIDGDKLPADQALVDDVQDYIAPPWAATREAEDMTTGGFGASTDATQTDDTGDSLKLEYNVGGAGTVTDADVQMLLSQAGIWQARARVKVDSIAGSDDLLQIGVYDVTASAWCKTRPAGVVDAVVTVQANDLLTTFAEVLVDFYWDGTNELELRVSRLTSDTTTVVWLDKVTYRSSFSTDTGEGLAPIGARVTIEPAEAVEIDVTATLTIAAGYDADTVKAQIEAAIAAYLAGLTFTADNDVRYVRIGNAILDVEGVTDYADLTVNTGTANIAIGVQQVAVLGTVTLT